MRILHIQETLSQRYGGPATVLPQLAKAQSVAGHEVIIATTNADYPRGTYHDPGWYCLGDSNVKVFYSSVQFAPLRASLGLAKYFWRSIPDFDIVHVHGLYRFPPTAGAYFSRKLGTPLIIRPHGSLDPYLHERSSTGQLGLKRLYETRFDIPNLNAASAIHYTSEEERRRASFLELKSPSFVVPNGLEWTSYEHLPERGRMRATWEVGDSPVVLFLGRLHSKKGLDLLVPAFDTVRRLVPEAQMIIAGPENDAYGRDVRRWVAERGLSSCVKFVGPLHGGDVVQAYVDADVFALPSYTENFGMTVVEAAACSLPVVISDQVNIHAEITGASAGLVTRCDVEEVAQALVTLLKNPQRRKAMGTAGRRLVRQRYSWPAIVVDLTTKYEDIIRSRGDD